MASPWERMKAKQSALPSGYKGPKLGGITSVAPSARATYYSDPVEKMRGKYFDNRQDVSSDRLERRLAQQQENIFNRLPMFKPVEGTGGTLLQSRTPGGPSIADVYEASARKYGPTPSELLSDIKYGAGEIFKGLGDFVLSGGVTGKILQGAKDLLTQPVDTAKRIGYGVQDMTKGYDPFTKQGVGVTPKIEAQPLPSLDLEAKMSAYEDPIKYYAGKQKTDKPNVMVADVGDAAQNYMNLLKNVQNLGNTPYGNFGVQNILSSPTFTYEKEIGPGTLSAKIGDSKAQAGYSIMFNKGGRVRGTGIMGAL